MEWDKLKTFYKVAKLGGFSKAAEHMHLTQSAVSRQIKAIEDRLQVSLFNRHGKQITLTRYGGVLFQYVSQMYDASEKAAYLISEDKGKAAGHLRIAATLGVASLYISPYIPTFLKAYPDISLSILASDDEPDLNLQHADIAIRPYVKGDNNLVQLPLLSTRPRLYASTEYLEKFGVPKTTSDLDQHRLIAFGSHTNHPFSEVDWHLRIGSPEGKVRRPFIQMNLAPNRCQFAEAGLGIVSISKEHPGIEKTNLIRVLPDIEGPEIKAYYTFSYELKSSIKIEILYEYLKKCLQNQK